MGMDLVPVGKPVTDMQQAVELSKLLAGSSMLPDGLRGNPANTFLVICWAAELGISPIQGFASIGVISGRPVLSGQLLLSKARQYGHKVEILENTSRSARVKVTRKDDGTSYEGKFDLSDAKRAGLIQIGQDGEAFARAKSGSKLPWELYSPDMLLWRAVARAVRFGAPEVLIGQFLTEEEAAQITVEQIDESEAEEEAPAVKVVDDAVIEEELKAIENTVATPARDMFLLDDDEQPMAADDAEALSEYNAESA